VAKNKGSFEASGGNWANDKKKFKLTANHNKLGEERECSGRDRVSEIGVKEKLSKRKRCPNLTSENFQGCESGTIRVREKPRACKIERSSACGEIIDEMQGL